MTTPQNDGGPVFACASPHFRQSGMTLRDYFAAAALTGICAHPTAIKQGMEQTGDEAPQFAADSAYEVADAMLAARNAKR
jgi:hypothetical protein